MLVRATPRAEVDVFGVHRWWIAWAIFPSRALFWSARSLPKIIVDNSPNMHNTGFFPDCYLLSLTDGSILIPYLARYSKIFKKPNFQAIKRKSTFIWKMLSQEELTPFGNNLWFSSTHRSPDETQGRKKERFLPVGPKWLIRKKARCLSSLVQWLGWVFEAQERKKERKKWERRAPVWQCL